MSESGTMNKVALVARILLGLVFFVFGLNGFLHFMKTPPNPAAGTAFMKALAMTGYMFPLIKGTEVVAGLMLLSNRMVPLGLVLLAPILVNIAAFHIFLSPAPAGMVMTAVLLGFEGFLAWYYRDYFRGVLTFKAH